MDDELQVFIADTTYSLVELPRSDTKLVLAKRSKLLGQFNLKTLVEDLGRVGMCIRLAYNGVTAAGPQYNELQTKVQDLGYDVTKLCDKSAITVSRFKQACATILTDLQATYQYLLDNFEAEALDTLAAVSEIAGQMAAAAEELHEDFDRQATKVRGVEIETRTAQARQASTVREKEKEENESQIRHEQQKKVLENAQKAEKEAEDKFLEYEMKEDEAIEGFGGMSDLFIKLANGLTSKYLGTTFFGEDGEDEATKDKKLHQWKQKKLEALEKRKECEDMRKTAYQQLTEFAVSIEKCQNEDEIAGAAVKALHSTMDGLLKLAAFMMQAAQFWRQMQEHCKALGEDRIKKAVMNGMERYDEAKRRKLWTSKGFKIEAINFYAGWVALDGVCGEYMSAIQDTQRELYKYITENPSYEEAKRNVRQLAADFRRELGEAQRDN